MVEASQSPSRLNPSLGDLRLPDATEVVLRDLHDFGLLPLGLRTRRLGRYDLILL
jgi:hypothetical protein